jgi:YaiO family outer membrane protein
MRFGVFAGLLWLACPTLLAAQAVSDYDAAVEARRNGGAERAIVLLDRWLAEHPDDTDALVQRGYAHLALGQRRAAERDFRTALALAPDYTDARSGLERATARNPDASGGFVIAGGSFSDLEAGRSDWWEASIEGEARVSERVSLGGRAAWYRRFGLEDFEAGARIAVRASDDVWLRAGVSGTPQADFRPELAFSAGGDWRVAGGPQATVLSLDAAWQRFPLQQVWSLNPAVTQYLGDGRWSATLRGIGIVPEGGNLEIGVLGRLDYAADDRTRFFVGAVNGPDTDIGIVSRVTSLFAGAELPLNARLSVLPSVAREWRSVGFDRTELRIDVKATF